jgi:hypothetical protein
MAGLSAHTKPGFHPNFCIHSENFGYIIVILSGVSDEVQKLIATSPKFNGKQWVAGRSSE